MGWRREQRRIQRPEGPAGAGGFYVVAVMSMLVSVDTSWRFFEHNLHITAIWERVVMFAVLEVAFIACGYGMRANVHRHGTPGAPRLVAWALCGMAGYMAWQLSGLGEGIARVLLGPVLGLGMLHLALGIERRARSGQTTAWARVGHEMRERLLSRLGLADDTRDALARTRDRAVQRAARLAEAGRLAPFRKARLARALRSGNVPHDPTARGRLLAELATVRHAGDLATIPLASPWRTTALPTMTTTAPVAAPTVDAGIADTATGVAAAETAVSTETAASVSPVGSPARLARPKTRKPSSAKSSGKTPGKRTARPSKAEYLERARAALPPGAAEPVTAQWVQDAVPEISRSMSYVIADALSTELSTNTSTDTSAGRSTDGPGDDVADAVVDRAADDAADGPVDGAVDVVDAARLVSVNGDGAR